MIGVDWAGERRSLATRAETEPALDTGEFERIYRRHWPDVFRYAWLLGRNHHDAEDVASEAFRRSFEAWCAGRGPSGEPLPWLLLITRRIVVDRHRRSRLVRWLSIEKTREPADERESAAFRSAEVWLWFEHLARVLPPNQREALLLRFAFDLADEDAAKVLGTSVGNTRTLVSRGLAALRRHPEVTEQ